MSRRSGRSLARRLAGQQKKYPLGELEKILRQELGPLGKGMDPRVQERLTTEAVAAAKEWWREHGGPGTG